MVIKMNLLEKVDKLPDNPGVYLLKDGQEKVLYVGKAKSLKKRVKSYFRANISDSKTRALVSHVQNIDYIITHSPIEALILECNLIKKHRPRYNVMMKDDKSYPYIKVTLNEAFPRILFTRDVKSDGSKYFGPYTDTGAVRELLHILKRVYPLRTCKKNLSVINPKERPCLNYHIKRCLGPCTGRIDNQAYLKMVREVMDFLSGKGDGFVKALESMMAKAVENLNFEEAALLRDSIYSANKIQEKQKIVSRDGLDRDVIAMARGEDTVCVQVFYIRNGKLLGSSYHFFSDRHNTDRGELIGTFIKFFYQEGKDIPGELLVEALDEEERNILENWLGEQRGKKVYISIPKRGEKLQLVEMAGHNALLSLEKERGSREIINNGLKELMDVLNLPSLPIRIEGFDISNIQGNQSVASMVVFNHGKPSKNNYRKFRIKSVIGPNDFASMKEVIERRFKGLLEGVDKSFSQRPDLVLIDGGKGQLSAAREAMENLDLGDIPTIGLAKEFEHIFIPNQLSPIVLDDFSPGRKILQQIRDEAHRFALTFHRSIRGKKMISSVLDEIPHIGKRRKNALLKKYPSIHHIKEASVEDLKGVEGMDQRSAKAIIDYFKNLT
jgi:excinuclease ABC subunit C